MRPPIYKPKGAAREYGDLALNIYTGCTHGCYYCFAPNVLHKTREAFSTNVQARPGIVEEVKKQLDKEQITGQLIHLCFTCDPYPAGVDNTATREIIELLKDAGNHVQILTKNGHAAENDFDLLDADDWFGVTYCGYTQSEFMAWDMNLVEPNAGQPISRLIALERAHIRGIKTWVSIEPVLLASDVLGFLRVNEWGIDKYKIGKLNYHPSNINWADFGRQAEEICQRRGLNYYIKDSLRAEMEKQP